MCTISPKNTRFCFSDRRPCRQNFKKDKKTHFLSNTKSNLYLSKTSNFQWKITNFFHVFGNFSWKAPECVNFKNAFFEGFLVFLMTFLENTSNVRISKISVLKIFSVFGDFSRKDLQRMDFKNKCFWRFLVFLVTY